MTTNEILKSLKRGYELLDNELSEHLDYLSKEKDIPTDVLNKCKDNKNCMRHITRSHDKEYLFIDTLLTCSDIISEDLIALCNSLNIKYEDI
ncbi:MAG: hypothetical protein PUG48_10780 [Clostridia bacterium]|nr:hypothetical protein [Clostridia bacterium]